MQITTLRTVSAVIDHLGGVPEVAKLTGRSNENVWNWRKAKRFSAATYLKMIEALRKKGATASPSLWGLERPGEPYEGRIRREAAE